MVYDWMNGDLKPSVRSAIHDALLKQGRIMLRATDPRTGRFWKDEFLQNHLWVNMSGLAAAALAMPEEPETAQWIETARDKFRRTEAALGPEFDFMAGDATGAYVPEAGLKRYIRRLVYLKPATLLVLDDIETDRPRNLELRFHPVENANAKIQDLTPEGVSTEKGIIEGEDRDGKPFPQYTVRMRTNASQWRHAAAISWANGGAKPDEVTMERQGDARAFLVGGREVVFPWKSGRPSAGNR